MPYNPGSHASPFVVGMLGERRYQRTIKVSSDVAVRNRTRTAGIGLSMTYTTKSFRTRGARRTR